MTNYIDFTSDDETTYKGKIDESLNLLRGAPVTSTAGGGVVGRDFIVSEWGSVTLINGITYWARMHTTNAGAYNIDGVSVKNPDGSDPRALQAPAGALIGWRYDGTNLIQATFPQTPAFTGTFLLSGSNEWYSFSEIRFTARDQSCHIRIKWIDDKATNTGDSPTDTGITTVDIIAKQTATMGSNPDVKIIVRNANGQAVAADSFAAVFQTVDANVSEIDLYFRDRSLPEGAISGFIPEVLWQSNGSRIKFSNSPSLFTQGSPDVVGELPSADFQALRVAGNDVLDDSDIGTTVQAQDAQLQDLADSLTATAAELNKNDDSAAAVTGYTSGMRTYAHTDGGNSGEFAVDTDVTEATWESVGPTGSGADNEWTALDDLPSDATIAIVGVLSNVNPNGSDRSTFVQVNARQTGSSAAVSGESIIAINEVLVDDFTSENISKYDVVHIPLDSSRRFDVQWNDGNSSATSVDFYLKGFIT